MFGSDTAAPCHPKVLEALAAANAGQAASYGADAVTARAADLINAAFERPCAVFFVPTGTAANALALAAMTPPWGAVIAAREAHVALDEAGAPEFFTGGAKLLGAEAAGAKLTPAGLADEAGRWSRAHVHGAQPFVAAITQATESGLAYRPAEVGAVAETARGAGLKLFMDGARFANACAFTGARPADLTWRAGVDALAFGFTKNGAMGVEAIVAFDADAARVLPHLRKRAGHLLAKQRFLAAQIVALLEDDLWLSLATHANAMAQRLARALARAGAELARPVEANAVFARVPAPLLDRLAAVGAMGYPWAPEGPGVTRFVAGWAVTEADMARCEGALAGDGD